MNFKIELRYTSSENRILKLDLYKSNFDTRVRKIDFFDRNNRFSINRVGANAHCFSELIQSVGLKYVRHGHLELR